MNTNSPALRWNNRALARLLWPLIVEQLLAVSIGMVDTVMVTAVGEAAVSGVSLVDAINLLLITAFTALATGGSVVASQYLGRREPKNASDAARQLVYSITLVSLVLGALAFLLHRPILTLIYGHIDAEVMANAQAYFWISALSYPFIALYNAGAAIFRSMGNSRVGMVVAFLVNILNIGGNMLFIYGMEMGVAGAALSTLISRAVAAVVLITLLAKNTNAPISLNGILKFRLDFSMIRRILNIGVPNGLENSVFQIGKLLVARIISSFGTVAIAANAVSGAVLTLCTLPGQAYGLALITVVGQCVGAGDYPAARKNTRKLVFVSMVSMLILSVSVYLLHAPILSLFSLSAETTALAARMMVVFFLFAPVFWSHSFTLPNALRAAGDARYTMVISLITMWLVRIGAAYLLAVALGFGALGVYYAMVADWIVRAICFFWRWMRGRWQTKSVLV